MVKENEQLSVTTTKVFNRTTEKNKTTVAPQQYAESGNNIVVQTEGKRNAWLQIPQTILTVVSNCRKHISH